MSSITETHREPDPDEVGVYRFEWSDGTRSWHQCGQHSSQCGGDYPLRPGVSLRTSARWVAHGHLHRVGGPAVVRADGTFEWWFRGLWHRQDGPAVVWPDGSVEWCRNGHRYAPTRLDEVAWMLSEDAGPWGRMSLAGESRG